jgi:hypothetical protein
MGNAHPADVVQRPVEGEYLAVRAVPGGRLSNGLVVDASILARLLGLRLLKLDAHITFLPANYAIHVPSPSAAWSALPGGLDDAVDLLGHARRTLDQIGRDLQSIQD